MLLVAGAAAQIPPDSEIRKILVERIDTFHKGVESWWA